MIFCDRVDAEFAVVPGATHLFEEPGSLQAAAHLARDRFTTHPPPNSARLERP